MATLKYLVIHCSDTPSSREVTKGDIEKWHLGPLTLPNGQVKYRGKEYPDWKVLPKDFIAGVPIMRLSGRGWTKVGYSDLIQRSGNIVNLVPYNLDDFIDTDEMTWGAVGINTQSRHVCLAGGRSDNFKPIIGSFKDVLTPNQISSLTAHVLSFIKAHPEDVICGHYHWANKSCPNFSVAEFCQYIGLSSVNYLKDKKK